MSIHTIENYIVFIINYASSLVVSKISVHAIINEDTFYFRDTTYFLLQIDLCELWNAAVTRMRSEL